MRIKTLAAVASAMLLGTVLAAQTVTYDYDKAANFSKFKTYTWVRGTNVNDALNHQRIVRAVDAQLALKGFTKVETSGNPDVLVAYHASFDTNLRINGFSSGWGGYRLGGTRSGTATAEEIVVGTLIVDMVEAGTKTIVWRGTATKELDTKANAEKREKNINRAAEKIFKNYPPVQQSTSRQGA
jgi:hypothetical protein